AALMHLSACAPAGHIAQRLDMQMMRLPHIDVLENNILALDREVAMVQSMRPFRMAIAEAEHEEVVDGRKRRLQPFGAFTKRERRRRRMSRTALPDDLCRRIL